MSKTVAQYLNSIGWMSCVEDGGSTFKQHWLNVMCGSRWFINETATGECPVSNTVVQYSNSIGWMSYVEDGGSTFEQHWVNVMYRRRWFNIGTALGKCSVFAGIASKLYYWDYCTSGDFRVFKFSHFFFFGFSTKCSIREYSLFFICAIIIIIFARFMKSWICPPREN